MKRQAEQRLAAALQLEGAAVPGAQQDVQAMKAQEEERLQLLDNRMEQLQTAIDTLDEAQHTIN